MTNDREQELERLEKELLAGMNTEDDLLSDISVDLFDTTPTTWEELDPTITEESLEITPEDLMDYPEEPQPIVQPVKKENPKKVKNAKKKEDRVLTTLMAIACFLCLGIIGVLIYWLEVIF